MKVLEAVPMWLFVLVGILAIWDAVWKRIALWKAARNSDLGWFIGIAIINSVGILPIIYYLLDKKRLLKHKP